MDGRIKIGQFEADFNQLIRNVVWRKGERDLLVEEYGVDRVLEELEPLRIEHMRKLLDREERELSLKDFVRFFVLHNPCAQGLHIYYIVALIRLFNEVLEFKGGASGQVAFTDLTSYICERIGEGENSSVILTHKFPDYKRFYNIVPQDLLAAEVTEDPSFKLRRLCKRVAKTDRAKHYKKLVQHGLFCPSRKLLLALDSFAPYISIYGLDLELRGKIHSPDGHTVVNFGYSQKQGRVGAILKDAGLIFWDESDNFSTSKLLSQPGHCELQIWYLEYFEAWVTASKAGTLSFWNLVEECVESSLAVHSGELVTDLVEIPYNELLAVAYSPNRELEGRHEFDPKGRTRAHRRSENRVTFWDMKLRVVKMHVSLPEVNAHTIRFLGQFQVLVTAGHEFFLRVFKVSPVYEDVNLCGKLQVHDSLVTTFAVIEDTSMVVSVDFQAVFKVWDVRSLACVQTIPAGKRPIVSRIIDLHLHQRLVFLDSRLNYIKFESASDSTAERPLPLLDSALFFEADELYLVTPKDLRIYQLSLGQCRRIIRLCHTQSEDVSSFLLTDKRGKFLLANQQGAVKLLLVKGAIAEHEIAAHKAEVVALFLDEANSLFTSLDMEGCLRVYRETKVPSQYSTPKFKVIRACLGLPKARGQLAVSPFHDLTLVLHDSTLFSLDYQELKPLSTTQFDQSCTAIQFVQPQPLLLCALSNRIILLRHQRYELTIQFTCLANVPFDFFSGLESVQFLQRFGQYYLSGSNQGTVAVYDLQQLVGKCAPCPSALSKPSYNPFREQSPRTLDQPLSNKLSLSLKVSEEFKRLARLRCESERMTMLRAYPESLFGTASCEGEFHMWRLAGSTVQLLCSMSLSEPFPATWDFRQDKLKLHGGRVREAVLLVEELVRGKDQLTLEELRVFKHNNYLRQFFQPQAPAEDKFTLPSLMKQKAKGRRVADPSIAELQLYKRIKKTNKRSFADMSELDELPTLRSPAHSAAASTPVKRSESIVDLKVSRILELSKKNESVVKKAFKRRSTSEKPAESEFLALARERLNLEDEKAEIGSVLRKMNSLLVLSRIKKAEGRSYSLRTRVSTHT